ncbi:hypothetical protein GCM10010517_00430 [Streptosporangium fragile]|uniref:Uncharacterized protein n=1 Tax=Streptosporangium fragile TaxID=46186 RepID=A0ABN3VNI5_9ACTN
MPTSPRPRPVPPPPTRLTHVPEATPTPTPTRTRTPRPEPVTPSGAPSPARQRLVLDRYADRRRGTDRTLVLVVMFTGVISVTVVGALGGKARR